MSDLSISESAVASQGFCEARRLSRRCPGVIMEFSPSFDLSAVLVTLIMIVAMLRLQAGSDLQLQGLGVSLRFRRHRRKRPEDER